MTGIDGIDRIVLFGDSMTDAGNLTRLIEPLIETEIPLADPNSGYVGGRFTNGLIYGEYLGDYLGKEIENYAIGGGQTLGNQSLLDRALLMGWGDLIKVPLDDPRLSVDMNFDTQIDNFLADSPGDLSKTAASVLMGGNDLFRADIDGGGGGALDFIVEVARSTFEEIEKLVDAGFGMVIINTIPLGPISPIDPDDQFQIAAEIGINFYNALVRQFTAQMDSGGSEIVMLDLAVIGQEIGADLSTFGFTASMTEAVINNYHFEPYDPNPNVEGYDQDQIVFFDYAHLTTAVHGVFGIYQAKVLTHNVDILTAQRNSYLGEDTDDLVLAREGRDFIRSSGGDDVVLLGLGNDVASLGVGDDFALGGSGKDVILGGAGNDVLGGNTGNDRLDGGVGNDLIVDGLGSDRAKGGSGDDVFFWVEDGLVQSNVDDTDTFDGGSDSDTLVLALTQQSADRFSATLSSDGLTQALADLGITISSIESVDVAVGRDAGKALLGQLASETQVTDADLWGLI